jgi:hypothetical protein
MGTIDVVFIVCVCVSPNNSNKEDRLELRGCLFRYIPSRTEGNGEKQNCLGRNWLVCRNYFESGHKKVARINVKGRSTDACN